MILSTERDRAPRSGRGRRWRAGSAAGLALALTLAGALAGCGAAPATSGRGAPGEPTHEPDVTVELVQLRADVAPRQAQVHVTNGTGEPLAIGEVRVEDPRFDGPATRVVAGRTSTVPAGGSVDIRVQLPPVDCEVPDGGTPTVVLELLVDEGAAQVTASAPDPLGFVAPLHARECRRERLADAATLSFTGFAPSPPGEAAALELTVTPAGGGAATIVGVQRTNLLDFDAATVDGAYPLGLVIDPGDEAPISIELPILPYRCDPHAVQEDKRGTIFDVRVEVDGEPGEIEVFAGEELRGDILSWVAEWCGFGG